MSNIYAYTAIILTWLLTYLAHSSCFLILAALCDKLGFLKQRNLAETVWRFALFGGLLSASLQLSIQMPIQMPIVDAQPISTLTTEHKPIQEISATSVSTIPSHKEMTKSVDDAHDATGISRSEPTTSTATLAQLRIIELPAQLKGVACIFVCAWLLHILFVLTKTCLSVFHLNRMTAAMRAISRSEIKALLPQNLAGTYGDTIQIYRCANGSGPFVCPNGAICLPQWVFEDLNSAQCQAILAHEIHHITRRDSHWRIARRIMLEIFFLQLLNRYADKKLDLLAEIDCDQTAIRASEPNIFAQALLRCAEVSTKIKPPSFAVPMAQNSSLLHRINLLLDEDYMQNIRNNTPTKSNSSIILLLMLILCALAFSMPTIAFSSAKIAAPVPTKVIETTQKPLQLIDAKSSEASTSGAIQEATNSKKTSKKTEKNKPRPELKPHSQVMEKGAETSEAQKNKATEQIKFEQATRAFDSKEYLQAFMLYSELANAGHVEAQYAVGEMLWHGEGVNVNVEKAKTWFFLAADQGHVKAQKYGEFFAQRQKRQDEINFYTTQFDGGKLKWTEETCVLPKLPSKQAGKKEIAEITQKVNDSSTCYNEYVLALKQSLTDKRHLPTDLRQIMRTEEIEKSTQLANIAYEKSELQAKMSNDLLTASFKSWNENQKMSGENESKYWRGLLLGMAIMHKK